MSRAKQQLTPRDIDAARQLSRQLLTFEEGVPSAWPRWLQHFQEVLRLKHFLLYGLQPEHGGYSMTFRYFGANWGDGGRSLDAFGEHLKTVGRRWGLFDPMNPEPLQRNRSMIVEPLLVLANALERGATFDPLVRRSAAAASSAQLRRHAEVYKAVGILDLWQLRALVCEKDTLLGWIGGFSEVPPTWRERALLQRLLPALHRRLSIEETLGAPPLSLVLSTALNEIASAAFVVGPRGTVDFVNALGQAQLDRSPVGTRKELLDAIANNGANGLRVTAVEAGGTTYRLVIGPRPSPLAERLSLANKTWELTPQQSLVLELVMQGHSNKVIAQKLNCATHTAELHVAAIRAKAGAESRSDLAAKFWMQL